MNLKTDVTKQSTPNFPKTNISYPLIRTGGKKYWFLGKFGVHCFLVTNALRFAHLICLITDEFDNRGITLIAETNNKCPQYNVCEQSLKDCRNITSQVNFIYSCISRIPTKSWQGLVNKNYLFLLEVLHAIPTRANKHLRQIP